MHEVEYHSFSSILMPSILAKRILLSYFNECFVGECQKTLEKLCDEYAWDYEPAELIGESIYAHTGTQGVIWHYNYNLCTDATKPNMRSPAYPHYKIWVEKLIGAVSGKPTQSHILFHFECNYGLKSHKPYKTDSLASRNLRRSNNHSQKHVELNALYFILVFI